ncbi:MAG: hypothetical protein PHD61_11260 [Bacteroidales bacterium]|nr:hypothetical protein [Lentimicrobiaceae bacterium]MDD5695866.1 hypothetical protein [Bacteroidales bacterium]
METKSDYADKLGLIYEMIENSKAQIKENAFFYLLWGWLVLIASLTHFILMKLGHYHSFWVWPIIMTAGMVISVIAGIRMGKRSTYRTHVDTAIIYLWLGFFFLLLVVLSFAIFGLIPWHIMNALIIAMYGLGTFVSGGILRFRPLIIGGICSWIISLGVFFVPGEYMLLLVALSIIIAYLIPGYMIRRSVN